MKSMRFRLAAATAAVLPVLAVAACSTGSGGGGSAAGKTAITLLTDNSPASTAQANAVIAAFEKANPTITVSATTRPGGSPGDNLIKTQLADGDMQDVFWYNSGALLSALAPAKNLVDLTNSPAIAHVDKAFLPVVSVDGKVYGAPWGPSQGGGILYNNSVYAKLGLQVPKTWAQFMSNSNKIKAAGITAVEGSFKDTWTTQIVMLGDYYNVQKADPAFAAQYTANKANYTNTPAALDSFQKLAEITSKSYYQPSAGSTTFVQGMAALAAGQAAQIPQLGSSIAGLSASQMANVGFFGIPGNDAANAGATLWFPGGAYIPKSSKHIAAAEKFLAFTASPAGVAAEEAASPPSGPYFVTGSTLPASAPQVAKDLDAYVTAKAYSPALEFLSPVKGPSLEQITTAVASGQTSATTAATQYDADVTQEAKQLGLPGW